MKHRGWIVLSGYLWFFIGTLLVYKGLKYIAEAAFSSDSICNKLAHTFGSSQQAATVLITLALFIGFVKGRFILAKTVRRVVLRITSLTPPIRVKDAYSPAYLLIMASMITLGISMKYLPIPLDIRGIIDIGVGSALINGALLYFRSARALNYSL